MIAYSHTARGQVASIVADGPPPLATFAYTTGAEGGSGEIPRTRDPEGETSGSERVNCYAAGRRTSRTLENGITSTYAYDADGQLTSLTHGSVETLTYTYDNMHRRTGEPSHLGSGAEDSRKRTRRVPMAAGSGRHQTRSSAPARTFGYDLTGQLIAVNQSSGNATFAYDAVGNRTVVTGASGAGSYTANNLNQYTTASGGALTYDANGNLATGGGATYTHNGNSRMVSAVGPGSATASFGRDGRNRDVKRTIDGVTTYLIYDGWNLVAEYNAAGTLTTQYIHGPRVDEILAKVTPASTTFPLPDALGSTIAVTDASGAVLERVHYLDAFGTPTFRSGTGVPLPDTSTGTRFLFTGREWFARLGLYDYRNRTYSPRLGRFVQTDPIRFAGDDVNLYRYAGNSVVALRDPSGLKWEEVGGTERIVVGWKRTGSIRWIIGPTDSIGLGIVEAGSASYEATVSIDCKCGTETRKASGVRRVADRETSLSEDALFVGKAVSGLSPVGPSGPSSGSLAKVGTLIAGVIASGAGNTLPNPVTVPPGSDPSAATAEVDANVPKAASDGVWAGGSPCNKL